MSKSNSNDDAFLPSWKNPGGITTNSWHTLRKFTNARIGLGRAGVSQSTSDQLAFQLAHACAQDAVKKPINWSVVETPLQALNIPILRLHSQAADRNTYLQRPDLGRCLSPESKEDLNRWRESNPDSKKGPVDICIVIADGLSAFAVEQQAPLMVKQFIADISNLDNPCSDKKSSVICLVNQGRVAIGDEVAELLDAKLLNVFIGERPGLSSPDSLGIYFTYQAQTGFTDAQRNCISNIRPQGLSFAEASQRLIWLMNEAQRLKLSGVQLKDESLIDAELVTDTSNKPGNFLIDY
jgi:ethanolamine ammonia-lyase small subunit